MDPLVIDVEAEQVRGAGYSAAGQWVVFWTALALDHEDGTPMTAAGLHRYHPWAEKSAASVGKEVSRHIGRTAARSWLASAQRTKAWALSDAEPAPVLSPSREAARRWLEARRADAPTGDTLGALVDATIAFHDGRMSDVLTLLPSAGARELLAPWSDSLRARAAAKLGDDEEPDALLARWRERQDGSAATRAVVARLTAAAVFRDRTFTKAEAAARLRKLSRHLDEQGDIATLGVVLNVLGVVERRAGEPAAAAQSHRRAAAYLGLVGDLYALQGALFNLALALEAAAESDGRARPDEAVAALHACVALCDRFDVARDSAQAEVTAAKWAVEDGRRDDATRWLSKAEALVTHIESELEWAFFHYVRGLAVSRWPEGGLDAAGEFRRAERLYADGGDVDGVARVRRAAARLGVKLTERAGSRGRR